LKERNKTIKNFNIDFLTKCTCVYFS